jgi:hypothetical protein
VVKRERGEKGYGDGSDDDDDDDDDSVAKYID